MIISSFAILILSALWFLLQSPGSLQDALIHPFYTLLGTQQTLNSTLLDVSETAEPFGAASRRLLKPFGVVRLIRIYDPGDTDANKKR